ncbi:MAG: NHL repeat-containing protein [Thermoanaerobaculia bacterium]
MMETHLGRALALALAAALAAGGAACRRTEKPGAAAGPPAGTPPPPAEAPVQMPSFRETAEAGGKPFSGLLSPRDASVDGSGRLWVLDFGHAAVRLFDAGGGWLGGWGGKGDADHALKDPCGMAVHGDDLYVADTWNGRIVRFDLQGNFKGKTTPDYLFYSPRGVAVGPDGRVWVADSGNNRVLLCEADLSNPRSFGRKGEGPEELSNPVGIAVGPSGRVYVADSNNRRVQVLDANGRFVRRFPVNGWGPSVEPYVEVGADETIYLTVPEADAVVEMSRDGREKRRWTVDGEGRKFERPTGIALNRAARVLYVVNTDTSSVSRLDLSAAAAGR